MLRKELLEVGCVSNDAFDILNDMKTASEVTIQLVSDLLTQDKIEEGTMQLDKAPVKMWSLVKESVRLFTSQVFYNKNSYLDNIIHNFWNVEYLQTYVYLSILK